MIKYREKQTKKRSVLLHSIVGQFICEKHSLVKVKSLTSSIEENEEWHFFQFGSSLTANDYKKKYKARLG